MPVRVEKSPTTTTVLIVVVVPIVLSILLPSLEPRPVGWRVGHFVGLGAWFLLIWALPGPRSRGIAYTLLGLTIGLGLDPEFPSWWQLAGMPWYEGRLLQPWELRYLGTALGICASSWLVWFFSAGGVARSLRASLGRCEKCGYLLCGLPEPRCPECGTPFERTPPDDGEPPAVPHQPRLE